MLHKTGFVAGTVCVVSIGVILIQINVANTISAVPTSFGYAMLGVPCHPEVDEPAADGTKYRLGEKSDSIKRSNVAAPSKLVLSIKSAFVEQDLDKLAMGFIQLRNATDFELNNPKHHMNRRPKVVVPSDVDFINSCSMTSQVELHAYENETWILQTFDAWGQPKTVGGDEYYVEYSDANNTWNERWDRGSKNAKRLVSGAAMAHDNQDGSYRLDFGQISFGQETLLKQGAFPAGHGTLYVNLQYSCGMGALRPTRKRYWKQGGALAVRFVLEIPAEPPMEEVTPQSITTNGGDEDAIDLSAYDMVYLVGDSTIEQFVGSYFHHSPEERKKQNLTLVGDKQHFFQSNTYILKNIYTSLADETSLLKFKNMTDFGLKHLPWVKNARKRALVVGAFMWDLVAHNDFDQQNDIEFRLPMAYLRMLMEYIKITYGDTVDIYFKSGTAVQVHEVGTKGLDRYFIYRMYYMSNSRADKLHQMEMELMKDLDIPVLDVYRASYFGGHYLNEGDGRHFKPEFNRWLLSHFYADGQR